MCQQNFQLLDQRLLRYWNWSHIQLLSCIGYLAEDGPSWDSHSLKPLMHEHNNLSGTCGEAIMGSWRVRIFLPQYALGSSWFYCQKIILRKSHHKYLTIKRTSCSCNENNWTLAAIHRQLLAVKNTLTYYLEFYSANITSISFTLVPYHDTCCCHEYLMFQCQDDMCAKQHMVTSLFILGSYISITKCHQISNM